MKPIFFCNTDITPVSPEAAIVVEFVVVLIFLVCCYLYLKD